MSVVDDFMKRREQRAFLQHVAMNKRDFDSHGPNDRPWLGSKPHLKEDEEG